MLAYALRRLFISIPVLILSTIATFLMVSASGNPINHYFGGGKRPPSQTVLNALKHKYWLDQSLPERYWHWIAGLFRGQWGPSTQDINIGHELWVRMLTTAKLVVLAMIFAAILAVIVGVVSAVKQYTLTDYTFTLTGFLFLSLPVFWFAILLKEGGIHLNQLFGKQIFYTIGESTPGFTGSAWAHFTNALGHLVLPTITLALVSYAAWSRYNRGSMLEVLNSDYVRLARAKGLSRRRVMIRHALRTALIPLTTVMALDLAAILGGAVVTETIYQWHAMGDFLLTGIQNDDVFVVLAWLLVTGGIVIIFNLLADLLYAVLDPRIRYA